MGLNLGRTGEEVDNPHGIAPYILAGGRSSRMGRDKAMIALGGKTLLARAVETLKAVPSLRSPGVETRVTVVGDRRLLEGADRSIHDRYPGCGPLGGIEAALSDLLETRTADWALFLPVDMPFLPAEVVDRLLTGWIDATRQGARVCHVVVDGRPQPLVSLVYRELHTYVAKALQDGEFRVTPVLKAACVDMARENAEALLFSGQPLYLTEIETSDDKAWVADETQRSQRTWFANLNSQIDVSQAETFFARRGSMSKQAAVPD